METTQQLEFFKDRGCHELQGHLLSPAVDASTFSEILARDVQEPILAHMAYTDHEVSGIIVGVSAQ